MTTAKREPSVGERHVQFTGSLSSLFSPELALRVVYSDAMRGERMTLTGSLLGRRLVIVQADAHEVGDDALTLLLPADRNEISVRLQHGEVRTPPRDGIRRCLNLLGAMYPFNSLRLELGAQCPAGDPSTSLRLELPSNVTRYTSETPNVEHLFVESGRAAPTVLGGIRGPGERFQAHLHYRGFFAYRVVVAPAVTMASTLLLDLSAMQLGDSEWRDDPKVILGLFAVNAGAIVGLATLRSGSTLRSVLNAGRVAAVLWVLFLTVQIRQGSMGGVEFLVDAGLKGVVTWLWAMAVFTFGPYSLQTDEVRRERSFVAVWMLAAPLWLVWLLTGEPLRLAAAFAQAVR